MRHIEDVTKYKKSLINAIIYTLVNIDEFETALENDNYIDEVLENMIFNCSNHLKHLKEHLEGNVYADKQREIL